MSGSKVAWSLRWFWNIQNKLTIRKGTRSWIHIIQSTSCTWITRRFNLEIVLFEFHENFIGNHRSDPIFGPILHGYDVIFLFEGPRCHKIKNLILDFELRENKFFYNRNLCVPRESVKDIFELVHDASMSGHLRFEKTSENLQNCGW